MNQLLRDKDIFPTDNVVAAALGPTYPIYETFLKTITQKPYALMVEWRYYRDGNAWLGKVQFKKTTVFWLSIWEGSFKTSFYFTQKTIAGISELDIDPAIKKTVNTSPFSGKLIPLVMTITSTDQLTDVVQIVAYKLRCM